MQKQKRDFDQAAAAWDDHPPRVKMAEDVAAAMMRAHALTPDPEVLDFGCGTGLLAFQLAPRVKSVTGADSSRGMLDVLEAKMARLGQPNANEAGWHGKSPALHHLPADRQENRRCHATEIFFVLSFDGRVPQGTVRFHPAFLTTGPEKRAE